MAEMANILEQYDLSALDASHGPETLHLYAEAWKRAYADRNHYLADPDFVDMPLERMTSPEYARERAATISMDASATPSTEIGPGPGGRGGGREHHALLDRRRSRGTPSRSRPPSTRGTGAR
jgi:gamma-glutamyltranspeptidase / glutathione hydrolase